MNNNKHIRPKTAAINKKKRRSKVVRPKSAKIKPNKDKIIINNEETNDNNNLDNDNEEELEIIQLSGDTSWLNMDIRYERLSALYDRQKHQFLKGFTIGPDVRCLSVVNGKLWEATRGGGIHIRNFQTGDLIREVKHKQETSQDADKFYVTAINPDNNVVWCGTSDGWLFCYDLSGKNRLLQMNEHTAGVRCITSSDDDEFMWSASEDFTILQRYSKTGKFVKKFAGHSSWVNSLVVDPIYGWLWSAADDGIRVWDPAVPDDDEEEQVDVETKKEDSNDEVDSLLNGTAVLSLCVVDKKIWCGLKDGRIIVFNALNRERITRFKAHSQGVHTICLVNRDIWTASYDKFVNCWDQDTFEKVDCIALNAEEAPRGLISKGTLRVADMVFSSGKLWLGCRSKGSLHSFRVFHPSESQRINVRLRRPPTPPPPPKQPKPKKIIEKKVDPQEEPEIDLLKLSLQELVNMWNNNQNDKYLRLLRKPEDPLNRKEGVFRIGNRKLRLVAMDGTIMVRVGGGYVTIDEFINNNASHFRTLARIAEAKRLNNNNNNKDNTINSIDDKKDNAVVIVKKKPSSSRPLTSTRNNSVQSKVIKPSRPSSSRPSTRNNSIQSQSSNLGHGKVSNQRPNSAVDVTVLSGKRPFNARRRGGGKQKVEEIIVDVGQVVANEEKVNKLEKDLKNERQFINKLLNAIKSSPSKDALLKHIDNTDKELSRILKRKLK